MHVRSGAGNESGVSGASVRFVKLTTDMSAPLPLGIVRAIERAEYLREHHGLSYSVIAVIMEEYHGVKRARRWWVQTLHDRGATLSPRGNISNIKQRRSA